MANKRNILIAVVLMVGTTISSVTVARSQTNSERVNSVVHLTVYRDRPGIRIPDNFPGFSYEAGLLAAEPGFMNADNKILVQMIKNLGNGILRIGGNSSDITGWAGSAGGPDTGRKVLTATDIDGFAGFAKATGWKVIFGLNLGDNNADAAVDEAEYLDKQLGDEIYVYQIGNEPDLYYKWLRPKTYDSSAFLGDWNRYYIAIRRKIPGIRFAGPDVSHNIQWLDYFAGNAGDKIKLLDAHYYRKSGNHSATRWEDILNPDTALNTYLNILKNDASAHNIPYRISECNSVSRGGKADVSDVFASALWGLDFMWTVAEHNGQGVNFHGGPAGHYTAIALKDGRPSARPLYYAMLAFKYGSENGRMVPVIADKAYTDNYSAYAITGGKRTTITLINKEPSDKTFSIQLNEEATNCLAALLTAPSPAAKDGVSLANSVVKDDGTFRLGNLKNYPVEKGRLTIRIPAMSAAVLFIK